ncbi:MAG: methyltransferase [Clostridia bacterium]|nr:methyltransferase [Clostridia bacterium]
MQNGKICLLNKLKLENDERLDDLNLDGLKIIQKVDGYGFTSDAVLLANFVKTKHLDVCVEVGAGSGVISILVNHKENPKKIYAFEIQKTQAQLANKNIELCQMQDKITLINDKVQNWNTYLQTGEVDVVFSNPPYFKYDSKVCGNNEQKVLSRFDKELSLDDFFESISKMLKFGGKLFFVQNSARLSECFDIMAKHGLVPKRIYFVHPNNTKDSTVFLCEAVKGGKHSLIVMPPLFTNDLDGNYIQTIQKLYKKG